MATARVWQAKAKAALWVLISFTAGCIASGGCGGQGSSWVSFDFVEHLSVAATWQETSTVDFGTPEARVHLLQGWSRYEQLDAGGTSFVWGIGNASSLDLFLPTPRDELILLLCRPASLSPGNPQVVTVIVNGIEVAEVRLNSGFEEYRVPVSASTFVAGENHVEFHYSRTDQLLSDPRPLAVAWDTLRLARASPSDLRPRADIDGGILSIPFGTRIDYFLEGSPEDLLVIDDVAPWGEQEPDSVLEVQFQSAGSDEVHRRQLSLHEGHQSLLGSVLDQQHLLRISLLAVSSKPREAGVSGLNLARPRLQRPGESVRDESLVERSESRDSPSLLPASRIERPNVIVYLIDALRADHLGAYGYQEATSPYIDMFAKEGALFLSTVAQSSWTKPSVASILTGLYPRSHGVNKEEDVLPDSILTLPELLRLAGYETAALSSNAYFSPEFGFGQGFDTFLNLWESRSSDEIHPLSDSVNQRAFEWLNSTASEEPFFLLMHTIDPHAPYDPPSPYREAFVGDGDVYPPDLVSWVTVSEELRLAPHLQPERVMANAVSLYDAEVAFNDKQFGMFVEKLKNLGLYHSSFIIFVSDHGEEFLDHGGWIHGSSLHREMLNIPLIVKFPEQWKSNTSVSNLAQQIDILPTVLDYLGLQIPDEVQGESLLPAFDSDDRAGPGRAAFSYLEAFGWHVDSILFGERKLIRHFLTDRRGYSLELYDVGRDPLERDELSKDRPVETGYLLSLLKASALEQERSAESTTLEIDEDLRRRLRALGYIQ